MATPEQIDKAERDTEILISVAHKAGLNSWEILDIFLRACVDLHLQATAEYRIKGGK